VSRPLPLHETFPQRQNSCYEEIREFIHAFAGSGAAFACDEMAEALFGEK
jgi:hypothetical protein